METSRAATWPRSLFALLAALALALALAPPTWAEHADGEHAVECDADFFFDEFEDDEFDDEEFGSYVTEPGQTVTCEAVGLDPDIETEWHVDFFDVRDEEEEEEFAPHSSQGDVLPAGESVFEFTVPSDIRFGWFEGHVAQGDNEEEYYEEFFGVIESFEEMNCEPDPVMQGEFVECVALGMQPGEEFWWEVHFFTFREFGELAFVEDEEEFEELFRPDVEGDGVADSDGIGVFSFQVPTDREMEIYLAFAEQEDYFAADWGEVIAAEEEEEHAEPVSVQPPTRVDTGVGGAAGNSLPTVLILGSLLAAAAVTLRRTTVGGR